MEPLDNPVWHALTGPHARFAQGADLALRYDPAIAVFAAMPYAPAAPAWGALHALLEPAGGAALVQANGLDVPPTFDTVRKLGGHQMIASERIGEPDDTFAYLDTRDVEDMLALVNRTRPGPFARRTIELGTYLGVREDGTLIAMAGERMHLDGYTEISAVCTDERARKRGVATRLVRAIAAEIEGRGETPILHVATENAAAIRVYEALGFETRVTFDFFIVRPRS
jgi:ribosomal protein S18 acetylase RimI-like enzyme